MPVQASKIRPSPRHGLVDVKSVAFAMADVCSLCGKTGTAANVVNVGVLSEHIAIWPSAREAYSTVYPALRCRPGAVDHTHCRTHLRALSSGNIDVKAHWCVPVHVVWVWVCVCLPWCLCACVARRLTRARDVLDDHGACVRPCCVVRAVRCAAASLL